MLTQKEILDYEINSSAVASHLSLTILQKLAGKYFAWKVRRKYARYVKACSARKMLELLRALNSLGDKRASKI